MEFLVFIAFAVGIGMFAKKKGRSPWGWGIASLFISPLLAGIILALMRDLSQQQGLNEVDMQQQALKERVAVNEVQINQRFEKVENQLSSIKKEVGMLENDKSEEKILLTDNTKAKKDSSEVNFCPRCGSSVRADACFCIKCGASLKSEG